MQNLGFGLNLTAIGMGIIFGLLALLWGVLSVIGRVDASFVAREEAGEGEEREEGEGESQPAVEITGGEDLPPEVIGAIAIAVATHAALVRREAAPSQRASQPGSLLFASRWLAAGRTRQTRAYGSHGRA